MHFGLFCTAWSSGWTAVLLCQLSVYQYCAFSFAQMPAESVTEFSVVQANKDNACTWHAQILVC